MSDAPQSILDALKQPWFVPQPHARLVIVRNFRISIDVTARPGIYRGPLQSNSMPHVIESMGRVAYSPTGWIVTPDGGHIPAGSGMAVSWSWDLRNASERKSFQEYINLLGAGEDVAPVESPSDHDTSLPDVGDKEDSSTSGGGTTPRPKPADPPKEDTVSSDPPAGNSLYIEFEMDGETGEMVPAGPYRGFPWVLWMTSPSGGQYTSVPQAQAAGWIEQGEIEFKP